MVLWCSCFADDLSHALFSHAHGFALYEIDADVHEQQNGGCRYTFTHVQHCSEL